MEEKTPVGHRRKAKSKAAIGEGGTWFAHIVGFFVISSKKREPINGTHAGIAGAIIISNSPLQQSRRRRKIGAAQLVFYWAWSLTRQELGHAC